MDDITNSGTFLNETEGLFFRNISKRKHSDSEFDIENTKRQKIDLQKTQADDDIKVENNDELLQSENDVSSGKKEENVKPAQVEAQESYIAHLKDDDALSLNEENELEPSLTISKIESNDESLTLDNHRVAKNDDSQPEPSEISCEKEKTNDTAIKTVCDTISERDTNSQNSDDSSTTGIDILDNGTSAVSDPEPEIRVEAKKFPKLYRLLREGEKKENGLRAKSPESDRSVANHVASGSNGGCSKYISTCSTLSAAYNWRGLKTKRRRYRNGIKTIVEIDVGKLPSNVDIIDLTSEELRKPHEVCNENTNNTFHKFAQAHGEVLLVGHIPADCLQYI